ncbi:hypothetical protein GLYMA_14G145100v4 [Glycine max]|uniref:DUF659 domain-containing protein n=1 Tax=Glycine max TaxID=3847 RepID=A0A0R0GKG8_SOYBN|nr:hypothetical protein JHK84_040248 [Glycine max]KRH16275.1 hypothetical protein GLYMA_14G145100v4 [Glycine max]
MFKPTGDRVDVFWKWNNLKDKNNRKSVTCDFCHKTTTRGISRAKRHQLQIKGDVGSCKKVPEDVKLEKIAAYEKKIAEIAAYMEAIDRAVQYIARFFFRNGIPFNVAKSKSFKLMIEAIGTYGPHLKPPSYHELRVPLLKKELEYIKGLLRGHEEERIKYRCSIMSDGWTDRKNKTLINFLTGQKIFELLDSFVEEIGEKNVIQVVTDNGSNYVLAGKILQVTRPKIFWTPCAAHCLDLMLEDIGKIPKVKRVIQRGIKLVGYIYNHTLALNTMRKFTQKTELVRHGVTRFATTFLTLQRLHKQKANLRRMFTSDEWLKSRAAKEPKGKQATDVVLMPSFWNDVVYALKAMGPLVSVLRLVNNEKKPAIAFNNNERKYMDILVIINKRWDCQLHHPLHAADYYLNPKFFYTNPNIDSDNEVVDGLYKCIDKLSEDDDFVVEVHKQLLVYKRAGERFGMTAAMKARTKISLAEWWKLYEGKTPHLQTIAIKIHSKKRSRLEHQKLQDLVYVKYNQALLDRFECHDVIDPIALNDIDDSNEWLLGELEGEEASNDLMLLSQVEVEEENEDEGEEEYNSNASESDGFQQHNDLDLEEDEDSD